LSLLDAEFRAQRLHTLLDSDQFEMRRIPGRGQRGLEGQWFGERFRA
jgi:hypothetical protein